MEIIFKVNFVDDCYSPVLPQAKNEVPLEDLIFRPLPMKIVSDSNVKKVKSRGS